MNELIKNIEKVENLKLEKEDYRSFDGFKITTDKQKIFILIENGQDCCEHFGYFCVEENTDDFIGTELLSIKAVENKDYSDKKIKETFIKNDLEFEIKSGWDGGNIYFIDIETSKGLLQFAVYNSHNGYYGHAIKIISKQLNHEEVL
jgi:hypothetical protein